MNKNSSTSSLKKDIMLFCVGLVTGGTLIGMGSKMFKKWILNFFINFLNKILKKLLEIRRRIQWNEQEKKIEMKINNSWKSKKNIE